MIGVVQGRVVRGVPSHVPVVRRVIVAGGPSELCGTVRRRHALAVKHSRARTGANRRRSVVDRGQQLPVGAGALLMLILHRRGSDMAVMRSCLLNTRRPRGHSTRTTIKARMVVDHGSVVVDDRGVVVGIVDDGGIGRIHIGDGAVVVIDSAAPLSAHETNSGIATAVIDSTIEPNMRTPVAGTPHIETLAPTPVARSPQHTDYRRLDPCTGNPIVAVRTVSPKSRCPDISGVRRWR